MSGTRGRWKVWETYDGWDHAFDHDFVEAGPKNVIDGFSAWEIYVLDNVCPIQEGTV